MLKLALGHAMGSVQTILCIGAHCDDIEIGCGGSILRWSKEYPQACFVWVVLSSNPVREQEARASAERLLARAHQSRIIIKTFRNGYFPYVGAEIKDFFETLKLDISPDVVLTHHRDDRHQDHRLVSDLTWNTFRDHFILEYEIPKYDGDLGVPNLFVCLDEAVCTQKVESILESFPSQAGKQWFSKETFFALMRLRGVEANSITGYAEAFYCRKAVF
jgi:LmbE family N-acetylglucosaminyl deacetylase